MGLSQIKVLGASLHGYQSQVNQELQNLKGQAARRVLLIIIMIIILLVYISNSPDIYRGYYTVAQRYEFYFWVAKQYFTNERSEWVKYCFCHEKIKFISSSRRVIFFLLYRQNDIDKIIEGNYQNYVIDKLRCEIMENKPLGSRM